jgi:predicted MFS family arabinose efflux permease
VSRPEARSIPDAAPAVASRAGGLLVVAGLAIGPAVGLGLARFAYALLLPAMRSSLHWSYATAGAINTANALGYLAGAMAAVPLARRTGARRAFAGGIAVAAVTLLGSAGTGDIWLLGLLRVLAGAAGAVSFVTGGGLAAELGSAVSGRLAAWLLGLYFAGAGAGVVLSGLVVPPVLAATTAAAGWRWGWLVMGVLAVLALAGAVPAALACREPAAPPPAQRRWPARRLAAVMGAYALFGVGYIAYMTFIVAFLTGHGASAGEISVFWVVLGVAAVGGGFAWPPVIARLPGGRGLAVVLLVVAAGAALPLVSAGQPAALASAVLFGVSFLAVVTAATAVARRTLPRHHWTPAIGTLTVAFAVGQCIGPVLAGALSDSATGLRLGLTVSAGTLAAGAVVALAQRHLPAAASLPATPLATPGPVDSRYAS